MSYKSEPNPSTRRSEDFPKTTTMPDGWSMDALMEAYNGRGERADSIRADESMAPVPVPATGGHSNGKTNGKATTQPAESPMRAPEAEELFGRRLEPFASDNTGMWL